MNGKLILDSLAGIYSSLYLVDLENDSLTSIKPHSLVEELRKDGSSASALLKLAVRKLAAEDHAVLATNFVDLNTLDERMNEKSVLRFECMARNNKWFRVLFAPVEKYDEGYLKTVIFGITNIDEDKQNEQKSDTKLKSVLTEQSEMFNEMLQNQSAGVVAFNQKDKKIHMMNAAALKIFGWDCVGTDDINYILDKMIAPKKDLIIEKICGLKLMDDEISYEFAVKRDDTHYICVLGHSKSVLLSNKQEFIISSFTNITKIKRMEQELMEISKTDGLTKINNRGSGERRIIKQLREGKPGMFCLFDVDKFKTINDSYGHGAGDAVLIQIAACLKKSFRDNDIVMRLGGDEFAAYAIGVGTEEVGRLCLDRFYKNLSEVSIPELQDRKVTVSLGAVFCREKLNEEGKVIKNDEGNSIIEETFDGLYQKADEAMYKCKKAEGNSYGFYITE